ncbi:MAG: TIGR02391 family protein [Planctomycetia bacterium]|nr:TIGR02391 family protein [Planctomycetia bacterium]
MPYTRKRIKDFFEIYHIHPKLQNAERLILKSEFESAAREAFVVVESVLREKSGLDLHGFDLATKTLKYEVDKQTGEITKQPLIAINDLKTETEKNEQDGIRYMLMGFFQGVRNLYQHNHIGSGVSNALTVVIDSSFFLNLLDGHSITKNGRWILTKVNYEDIYDNMPKRLDRIRLLHMAKRRQRTQTARNGNEEKE